jgi:hypothetical protein
LSRRTRTLVALGQQQHVLDRERRGAHERIKSRDRLACWQMPAKIERRPRHCGDRNASHTGDFVVSKSLVTRNDPAWRSRAVQDQFNRGIVIHPLCAMQCRSGYTRDDSPTLGPQPCSNCPVTQRHLVQLRNVDITENRPVPPLQSMPRKATRSQRLGANEDLPHGQMMAVTSDIAPKLYSSRKTASERLLEYSFGG